MIKPSFIQDQIYDESVIAEIDSDYTFGGYEWWVALSDIDLSISRRIIRSFEDIICEMIECELK